MTPETRASRARATRWSVVAWRVLIAVLLVARLPSLAQPAGADQGLYAYVGTRILDGGLPYRDAWDQKPPAIHGLYAVMYALWPHDSVVAAADLAVAAAVAFLLVPLGRAVWGGEIAGRAAAAFFLLLGDPALTRLAGVRVRSQCETFIALAVVAALLLAVTSPPAGAPSSAGGPRRRVSGRWSRRALAVGLLVGAAVMLKYNAIVYAPVAFAALVAGAGGLRAGARTWLPAAAGLVIPALVMLGVFAAGGALRDWYDATITYNLLYSGETYQGPWSYVRYLFTFPVGQARVDAIWTLGGFGCLVIVARALIRGVSWRTALPVLWVGAACLSIAINGSRGLPQYFVQAIPALALAAGVATAILWPASLVPVRWRWAARLAAVALVAIAAARVTDLDKIPRNAAHDLAYAAGRLSRDEHLARYGGRDVDKYSAAGVVRLSEFLEAGSTPGEPVYIFGFSPGAYVRADRVSASRFFWSRPVIVGFNAGAPGYGAEGVLGELRRARPVVVVLQIHDWAPPPGDSATYFLTHPLLGAWLRAHYTRAPDLVDDEYDVWVRRPL